MPCIHRDPIPGEVWLSRPPFLFHAHVLEAGDDVEYEIHDRDGSLLIGPIREPLDDAWWRNFQPLERRYG